MHAKKRRDIYMLLGHGASRWSDVCSRIRTGSRWFLARWAPTGYINRAVVMLPSSTYTSLKAIPANHMSAMDRQHSSDSGTIGSKQRRRDVAGLSYEEDMEQLLYDLVSVAAACRVEVLKCSRAEARSSASTVTALGVRLVHVG